MPPKHLHGARRRRIAALATGLAAAATVTSVVVGASLSANAAPVTHEIVVSWGKSAVVTLPEIPADATSVKMTVSAKWAWKPTRISVCPASTTVAECSKTVTLTTPVQKQVSTTVTLALPAAAKGKLLVYNRDASARIGLTVLEVKRGTATTTPKPTATATTTPKPTATATATATPKPTATATATPKPTATPTATATATPTATPKPTATPTSSPSPAPSTGVGVPAGTKLTVHEGDLTISKAGQVVEGLDVRGLVRVKADGVVIKNSVIRGRELTSSMGLITNDLGAYRFTVENSTLAASNPSPWINGIIGNNFTVRNTEIKGVIDSLHITGSDVLVEGSWLHDNLFYANDPNQKSGPSHADSIQIQGGSNIVIRNNVIEDAYSSAVQTTQDRGAVTGLKITGNKINGGGCSVNIALGSLGPLQGTVITDNTFGLDTRIARCAIIAPTTVSIAQSGNVYVDGKVVTVSKG